MTSAPCYRGIGPRRAAGGRESEDFVGTLIGFENSPRTSGSVCASPRDLDGDSSPARLLGPRKDCGFPPRVLHAPGFVSA
jgi:hypothetical protein